MAESESDFVDRAELAGVWIVAAISWTDYDGGPGWATPYPNEMDALRAVNESENQKRAYFVEFGTDLREVMS